MGYSLYLVTSKCLSCDLKAASYKIHPQSSRVRTKPLYNSKVLMFAPHDNLVMTLITLSAFPHFKTKLLMCSDHLSLQSNRMPRYFVVLTTRNSNPHHLEGFFFCRGKIIILFILSKGAKRKRQNISNIFLNVGWLNMVKHRQSLHFF